MARRDASFALAEAAVALRAEALPAATVAATKRLVLDSLAVAYAGRGRRDAEAVLALAEAWGGKPECSILGSPLRVPAPQAALVNGTMIQALDFDDTHDPSAAHMASTVLAAALAVGETLDAPGLELIAAVVAGVEVAARIGLACKTQLGFTSTAVYGVFGATVAAARLLGLDATATRHALGIAISQAAGTSQTAFDRPLSKHIQSGFAAQAGVVSAQLAQRGVTGVEHVFQGPHGFFRLYKEGRYDFEKLVTPWGPRYEVERLSFKPWPSCRGTHGPIDAALAIAATGVDAKRVAAIDIEVPPMAMKLAGGRFVPGDDPEIAAQFSIAYTVAVALLRGQVGLADFVPAAIARREVRTLADRVATREGEGRDFVPAKVTVTMQDGSQRVHAVTELKGAPATPLTDDELLEKVRDCLAFAPPGCTALDAAALANRCRNLDRLPLRQFLDTSPRP